MLSVSTVSGVLVCHSFDEVFRDLYVREMSELPLKLTTLTRSHSPQYLNTIA